MGKEYTCQFCQKQFKRAQNLATHKYRVHSKSRSCSSGDINQPDITSDANIQHDKRFLNYEKILQELDMLKEKINILKIVLKIYENILLKKSEG